jgi:hypothetical protein
MAYEGKVSELVPHSFLLFYLLVYYQAIHPNGLWRSGFPTKIMYTVLISTICVTYPTDLIIFMIGLFSEEYKL